jgi:hypothetical protein
VVVRLQQLLQLAYAVLHGVELAVTEHGLWVRTQSKHTRQQADTGERHMPRGQMLVGMLLDNMVAGTGDML